MKKFNFTVKSSIRNYDVIFDSIENIQFDENDFIIIDSYLGENYNIHHKNLIAVYSSEKNKEYLALSSIIDKLIERGFKRNNRLIGIGGGVIQDITGFIASMLYRGVEWKFIPTTLLAQGDSCIGSKTSINFGSYKNLVGNFYPPTEIIIDTNFLKNLPQNQIMSGIGEMMHYFLIDGEESFAYFTFNLNDYENNLGDIIYRSLNIKKRMIEIDEFDQNERKVFNYGHSFGHAIETMTNYEMPHGIAVSYGMSISNYVSYKLKYITEDQYLEMEEQIRKVYSYMELPTFDIDQYIETLKKDKKNIGSNLGLILTRGLGKMFLQQVPVEKVKGFISEKLNVLFTLQ